MAKVLVITNCKMCPHRITTNVDTNEFYIDQFHYCSKIVAKETSLNFLGTDEDIEMEIPGKCPLRDAEEE